LRRAALALAAPRGHHAYVRYVLRSIWDEVTLVPRSELLPADKAFLTTPLTLAFELDRWLGDPVARRTLADACARARPDIGGTARDLQSDDSAWLRTAIVDATRFGELVVLKKPLQWAAITPEQQEEEEPAEPTPVSEKTTWFEVKLVDEVGEPISGVALTVAVGGKNEKATTNGAGKAKVEGKGGVASVTFDKESDLRKKLKDLWAKPRGKKWYDVPGEEADKHTVIEVRRTQSFSGVGLVAEETHTVVFQPRVVQANLKGLWFATSKSFLLPAARHSLQLVKHLYDQNHECDMLVVGHTDTEGSASYNDPLSLERAESVVAYLKDDVDAWYAWYGSGKPQEKRWGATEDHEMIRALAEESGTIIPAGTSEVSWYQESRGLKVDGIAGEQTRKALIKEYLGLDGTTLPDDIKPVAHGCGENFPAKPTGDNKNEAENRRVEIFFFDNPIAPPDRPAAVLPPPPGKNSKAGSKEYPEWLLRVSELHEFEAGHWIRVLMRYDDGVPAKNVPFLIRYEDGKEEKQITSDDGILMVHGVKEQKWTITGIEDTSRVTTFQ
jgi:outer membrane protein OmpA-like peptidoglycan-associated protein